MPISNDDFSKGIQNTQIQDFLRQNPDNVYSFTELCKLFGNDIMPELQRLVLNKILNKKIIVNPKTKKEGLYFQLRR